MGNEEEVELQLETDGEPAEQAAAPAAEAVPEDPWADKKDGKDPWRRHPLAGPASVLVLLAALYFITAGWVYGKFKDDPTANWVQAYYAPAEMLRGYSGLYFEYSEWQVRSFEEVDELIGEPAF